MTRSPTWIAGYAFAHGDDGAGHLVAEDARGGVRAVVDLLQIGSADAAGGDFDQQLAGADGRDRDGFDAHVVDAAIDHGAHGGGNPGVDMDLQRWRFG